MNSDNGENYHLHGSSPLSQSASWAEILIAVLGTLAMVLWTTITNSAIIVALNRRSRSNPSDLYFVNMDIIDVISGLVIFPLMATSVFLNYFPFGSLVCHIWVFVDYYLAVSSAFGYTAIMINYLWMIRWPRSYVRITRQSHIKTMVSLWALVAFVWVPAFIEDRATNRFATTNCGFDIRYKASYICLGIAGLYGPFILGLILMVAYLLAVRTSGLAVMDLIRTTEKAEETRKIARDGIWAVLGMFALFTYSRIPFYVFFGFSTFMDLWLEDVSNWVLTDITFVFWVLHSNSALSPFVHLAFDRDLRLEVLSILKHKIIRLFE